ncbi:hypothetical protein V2J09_007585 [Rumex salicifolius]
MASSSGNSSEATRMKNSSSEEDLTAQITPIDERKRKRMESNRESARRSRMRKQKHLDDLTVQISDLRMKNTQILNTISFTTQQFLNVEAENSVLRAQMAELSHRLDSLNDILGFIHASSGVVSSAIPPPDWSLGGCVNLLPIMASVDYPDFGY